MSNEIQTPNPGERKEKTLEELVAREEQSLEKRKASNLANIQKLEARAVAASGEERERLLALVNLHKNHKKELEKVNPENQAKARLSQAEAKKAGITTTSAKAKGKSKKK